MVATKYPKSVSVDFSNGVAIDRLTDEIRKSAIITAFDHILVTNDVCDIWFKDALSAGDQTILNSLVSAHSGLALSSGPDLVRISEEGTPTGGFFESEMLKISVLAGTAGDITSVNFTWPFPISMLASNLYPSTEHVNDSMDVLVDPDKVLGSLDQDVAVGANTFYTSGSGFKDGLFIGQFIKLDDGVHIESLGRVTEKGSDYFKTENVTVNSYLAATPTYIKRTAKFLENFVFFKADIRIPIGMSKIGGSYIPAGTVFNVRYTNNGTAAKTMYALVEYLY